MVTQTRLVVMLYVHCLVNPKYLLIGGFQCYLPVNLSYNDA